MKKLMNFLGSSLFLAFVLIILSGIYFASKNLVTEYQSTKTVLEMKSLLAQSQEKVSTSFFAVVGEINSSTLIFDIMLITLLLFVIVMLATFSFSPKQLEGF